MFQSQRRKPFIAFGYGNARIFDHSITDYVVVYASKKTESTVDMKKATSITFVYYYYD